MKIALITGGTRGIGRALVEGFLRAGYRTLFLYRRSEAQAQELQALGALGYRCDIGNPEELKKTAERILSEEGRVDVLINNAGISLYGLFPDLSDEQWETLRSVDLDAPVNLCRAFLPGMISRKYGRILNISSMWGQVGASCEVAYSTVKAGLIGLTKALAKEVGPSGITVNCICPGVIDTDMNAALSAETLALLIEETPVGRLGTPEDVARVCLFLAGEDAGFLTGQVVGVNGGLVVT